jgi:carbamoyltransferase
MIAWGINALNHGSSLAVFKDGKLISNVFNKEDELTTSDITEALHNGSPDRIYWYENPWLKKARQIRAAQYSTAFDLNVLPSRYLKRIKFCY